MLSGRASLLSLADGIICRSFSHLAHARQSYLFDTAFSSFTTLAALPALSQEQKDMMTKFFICIYLAFSNNTRVPRLITIKSYFYEDVDGSSERTVNSTPRFIFVDDHRRLYICRRIAD